MKAILLILVAWGLIAVVTYAVMKYGLPEYLDYRESKDEREHEKELKEQERVDALVEEAENEYGKDRR